MAGLARMAGFHRFGAVVSGPRKRGRLEWPIEAEKLGFVIEQKKMKTCELVNRPVNGYKLRQLGCGAR